VLTNWVDSEHPAAVFLASVKLQPGSQWSIDVGHGYGANRAGAVSALHELLGHRSNPVQLAAAYLNRSEADPLENADNAARAATYYGPASNAPGNGSGRPALNRRGEKAGLLHRPVHCRRLCGMCVNYAWSRVNIDRTLRKLTFPKEAHIGDQVAGG
jgi:hypothetical protein